MTYSDTDRIEESERLTIATIAGAARDGRRLTMVTAYDYPTARLANEAGIDLLLVGDSVAMVVLGRESTTSMTVDEMVLFTKAVSLGAPNAIVVGDLPFMSYQASDERAVLSAGRLIADGGADCVKLEGGGRMVERASAIVDSGIAVIGHLGLTPQSAASLGGFKAQARSAKGAAQLLDDARRLQDVGVSALVLEAVPADVAILVTERLDIPTIGIGAGAGTSGQVLVWHDMLGYSDRVPRFVEQFGDLAAPTRAALAEYVRAVRGGTFPASRHTYSMPKDERQALAELS